jgi:hypothetical protein
LRWFWLARGVEVEPLIRVRVGVGPIADLWFSSVFHGDMADLRFVNHLLMTLDI